MLEYREAETKDSRALLLHLSTVGGETDNLTFGKDGFQISEEREARFIGRFKRNSDEIMYIAADGEAVVANGVIERERIPRLSHRARLTLTVLRNYWGQGIGTALMKMMLEFCRKSGVRVVSLECRADNERAIGLYRKFGFYPVGTMRDYFKIKGRFYDALLMELIIE